MSEQTHPKTKRKVSIPRQKFIGNIYVNTVGLHILTKEVLKSADIATLFKCDTRDITAHYKLYKEHLNERGIEYDPKKKAFYVKELKFKDKQTNEFRTAN
jgi:hypothetical protein